MPKPPQFEVKFRGSWGWTDYYDVGANPKVSVRVGKDNVWLCLTCNQIKCIHVNAVHRFIETQPQKVHDE